MTTATTVLSREEKFKLIQEEVLTTSEAAEFLGISIPRMFSLIKQGKLVPMKKTGAITLFLREDIENRKKSLDIIGKPAMAILPDGTEIKAETMRDLIDILQQTCDVSATLVNKLAKTEEPFRPTWQKLEPLRGLVVKYIEE